ncbi:MAG: DUF1016 domain-containing protein [Planctomycetes bacterium]|nr:DUF1016 domain-containing protein [Planctomycetota bacterium]
MSRTDVPADYPSLLTNIKQRIRTAQVRAAFSANAELIRLYWDIGQAIEARQRQKGWGAGVIPRLARDLHNEIPDVKGFSERNLKRMIAFYRAHREHDLKVPQPVALLTGKSGSAPSDAIVPQAVAQLRTDDPMLLPLGTVISHVPWGHHILLLERVKDSAVRFWYMRQVLTQGWSRNVLGLMIDSDAHLRQGKAITNFDQQLPPAQSDLATQALKDPYIFDFLTLEEPFHERELETGLLVHVEKFLLELGQGFAFVGRQYHLDIGDDDFYIDLLFYHLRLRCFVVVDLKKGPFKMPATKVGD